jgi:hypothetical protein
MDALFGEGGRGRIVSLEELPHVLDDLVARDFCLDAPNPDVLYTHRVLEGRHVYFVINNASAETTLCPTLREPGPYRLYRPLTGAVGEAGLPLQIDLAGYEGVFVVCSGGPSDAK